MAGGEADILTESLFNQLPDAILLVDGRGVIRRANLQAERLFGHASADMVGRRVETLMPAAMRERHVGHRTGYAREPHTRPMGAGLLDLRGLRADGSEFPLDIMLAPVTVEGEGLTLAVVRDATGRKAAEEALRQNRAMFERLFEHSPDAVVVTDEGGRIERLNAQAERLFGLVRHDLVGRPVEVLLPERHRARHVGHRTGYGQDSGIRPMGAGLALAARHADGSEFPVDIMLSPIETETGRLTLAVIRDISERRRAEAQRQEAERRAAMLREVHHRVKNNLQVVSSMLSLQGEAVRDRAALAALAESQNRIASIALIHEKLYRTGELGRIDFGDYVEELCTNLLRAHGPVAGHVALDFSVEPMRFGLDTAVPCGLVVNELVSNALKHAFPGGREGRVGVRLRAGTPGDYALEVEDDGVGLPPALDPAATGTLGLQLVHLLTGQLDGRVEVLRPGQGACFRVLFREVVYRERG